MTEDLKYDWTDTFESLQYQAEKRGQGDTKFSTCLKCVKEELEEYFDKEEMVRQGKEDFNITVIFVSCDRHAGATV